MNFVILGQARTGSTLLVRLLHSHPQVQCDGEIFGKHGWRYAPKRYLGPLVRRCPEPYIWYKAGKSIKSVYGFKLLVNHLAVTHRVITGLHRRGWQIIHIQRRSLFDITLSRLVAAETGQYGEYKPAGEPDELSLTLPPDQFMARMEDCLNFRRRELNVLKGIPYLAVTYEDDLLSETARNRRCSLIFEALQIEPLPVSTTRARSWNRPYSDLVVNYAQLQALMQTTAGQALQAAWTDLF